MLDLNLIRDHPDLVRKSMRDRQMDAGVVDSILALDEKRRLVLTQVEKLKAERNVASKEIGQLKDGADRQARIEAMRRLGDEIAAMDRQVSAVDAELGAAAATVPNIPDARTPLGAGDDDDVLLKAVGEPRQFTFKPIPHWDLGPALGIIDFERGTKITGSRFYVLNGPGARLQRALIAFMLDLHGRQGYQERYLPFMVRTQTVFGAGQLPKFADNLYKDHEEDLYMVPTAEVPLTGLHMDEILDEASLPRRYMAYTPCFRREKMSAGRDVRGIKRGHQFDKVEMYIFCRPEESDEWLGTNAGRRRGDLRRPWARLPGQAALHRQHRLRRSHHVRHRGLGAGLRRMVGGLLRVQCPRLPGTPCEYQVSHGRKGEVPLRAYSQRLGARSAAYIDRGHGKLPAAGWLHCRAGGAPAMDGRPGAHHRPTQARLNPHLGQVRRILC